MTDSSPPVVGREANEHLQLWAGALARVLEQICGAPCAINCLSDAPEGAPAPDATDSHLTIVASGSLRGEMNVRFPLSTLAALAGRMLGETPPTSSPAGPASEHREAVEELFRQVAGQAATSLSSARGDVQLRVEAGTAPTWAVAATAWMVSSKDAPLQLGLEWQLSAALAAELAAAARAASSGTTPAAPQLSRASSSAAASVAPSYENVMPGKFDLFKDVELDVSLRFGGRRMLLREVLELGPGSIVELDHQVQEPVDLLLDGRTIAHGEVVVVDGNYGLRVLKVAAPQE